MKEQYSLYPLLFLDSTKAIRRVPPGSTLEVTLAAIIVLRIAIVNSIVSLSRGQSLPAYFNRSLSFTSDLSCLTFFVFYASYMTNSNLYTLCYDRWIMDERLKKPYNPVENEESAYRLWESSGFFNPDNLTGKREKSYTILMPPPNANGHLHVGHALGTTIQDIMIRYRRMAGYRALWLPGADHAGFETQVVYEKKLEKEGRSRLGMPREELYKEILAFTLENKKFMEDEVRALGASCDWSREKFTLDPDIVEVVYGTFRKLFNDGLVYRGKRIVNWCTKHQTSLSDLEAASKTQKDILYYISYGPLTVATVRPETIFGDVAVAVHPSDTRYRALVGSAITVTTPIGSMDLPVIADETVDTDFGTGALKITPAHDQNDFEMGKRHSLPVTEVIDQYGKLNEKTGKYAGMKIDEARNAVAKDLAEMGLLVKTEEYEHAVSTCYKCAKTLEPRILPQWFVKMEPLAARALEAVRTKEVTILPDYSEKVFNNWLSDIRDWNISRQITWGIPIPAKICSVCDYGTADTGQSVCPGCSKELVPDPDTFDTWFSSGQWPFATLGHPDGEDFHTFYPTAVMETAYDILFFWVARMIMLGLYRTGKAPFNHVYLHGLVRDATRQKMSKSKGNVVNPIELLTQYGTDALRMGLIVGNTPGTDLAFSEDKIRGYKHFANKIWNVARFVLERIDESPLHERPELTQEDEARLQELSALTRDVSSDLDEFRFHLAGEKLYHYFWHTFADKMVEESKVQLKEGTEEVKRSTRFTLLSLLCTSLVLLHPFMPFITETLWQLIPAKLRVLVGYREALLMIAPWPLSHSELS